MEGVSLSLISMANLCGGRFATPHIDFRIPHTSLYGVCHCLIVSSKYIARSNAASFDKTLTLFSPNFACTLLCAWAFLFIQEIKTAEEKKINKNVNEQMTDG